MFKNRFIEAVSVLAGTIIGVGLFSLPYLTYQSGLITVLSYFVLLSALVILICLMYGEIALRTKRKKRLPGYAKKYLGKNWARFALFFETVGFYGAIIAYLIVGGEFLTFLCQPFFGGSKLLYTVIYFIAGALLIYSGIKSIAKTEFFCIILFFLILILIFYQGFSSIKIDNYSLINLKNFFLPYGAVLFSLGGIALIPEVKEILKNNPKDLKKAIYFSVILAAVTYFLFILLVVGMTGKNTSVEAISGLERLLGNKVLFLAFAFGVLTTFTSFITLGLTLKKIFHYDVGLKKNTAWFLTCFIPFFLFLLGIKNFILVISITGGVTMGIDIIVIIFVYLKAKKEGDVKPAYNLKLSSILIYSLLLFFVLGVAYQIYYCVK